MIEKKNSHIGKYVEIPVKKAGTYYIEVRVIKGLLDNSTDIEKEALYKIVAKLYTEGYTFPYDYFIADGKLLWSQLDTGKVRV